MGKLLLLLIYLSVPLLVSAQNPGGEDGLVGYWPFDEVQKGAILEDASGFHTHAKTSGAMPTMGIKGSGLKFDGRDDVVTILTSSGTVPAHLSNLEEGTLSLWFKLNALPDGKGIQPIFYIGAWTECSNMFDASNQGIILEVGHHPVHMNSGRLYFTVFSNGCTGPSLCFDSWHDLEADRWYHFAVVVGTDYNQGYVDGLPMEFIHYTFGNETYSQFFGDARRKDVIWIGKGFWDAEPYYLNGLVDEIRIYNRPLSNLEINNLYHSTLSTNLSSQIKESGVGIYPNPVQDQLFLKWPYSDQQKTVEKIIINDARGGIMQMEGVTESIDVSGLGQGYYMIHIISESGVIRLPFVKAD